MEWNVDVYGDIKVSTSRVISAVRFRIYNFRRLSSRLHGLNWIGYIIHSSSCFCKYLRDRDALSVHCMQYRM